MKTELPTDTLKIECLVQSLQNVIAAKTDHDKARDHYSGYSWGYYGHAYVAAMTQASRNFEQRLEQYINEAIERKLNAIKP